MPVRVRRKLLLLLVVGIAALVAVSVAAAANGGFTPATPHSPNAHRIITAYDVILGFTAVIFVIVETTLVVFIWKYRSRGRARAVEGPQVHGHTRLELIWTALPAVILAVISSSRVWP
jgi:cytochrome c oxidase subunit 2